MSINFSHFCEENGLTNIYKIVDETIIDDLVAMGYYDNVQFIHLRKEGYLSIYPEYINGELLELLTEKCDLVFYYEE